MTVTELRDALNAIIEQGHGDLPATFFHANSVHDEYHVTVNGVAVVNRWRTFESTDGEPVIELFHKDDDYLAERRVA